jgi:hypothetical protein
MTPEQALDFVRTQGIALESASGRVPSLASIVTGERVRGSWWSHPRRREIFAATRRVRDCPDVLVCRLIEDKITFVHRRLWPALVRLAPRIPPGRLNRISETHTAAGKHVIRETPFPHWVPEDVAAAAAVMSDDEARLQLGTGFEGR